MSKRKKNKSRSRNRAPKPSALVVDPDRAPEPRMDFHFERQPGFRGDYEILLSLRDRDDSTQYVAATIRPPKGDPFEKARRDLPEEPRLVSDAGRMFGIPDGMSAELVRDLLTECRTWIRQDDAYSAAAAKKLNC